MTSSSAEDPAFKPENRVPFRYFSWILDSQFQPQIDIERLLDGLDESLAWLQDPDCTLAWGTLCHLMTNLEQDLSPAELVEMGKNSLQIPTNRVLTVLIRNTVSLRRSYRWAYQAKTGLVPKMYPPLETELTETGKQQYRLVMRTKPGLEAPASIFLVSGGQMISGPRLFGLSDAEVEMHPVERGYEFLIHYPDHKGVLGKLSDYLSRVFFNTRNMQDLNESLQSEYRKLETTL
ncbi:MAG: hypothetical protein KDI36_18050, partial [Pseudomonadales bacterium]|nr:hypothetical protein [Pseudomonadales bacterium]